MVVRQDRAPRPFTAPPCSKKEDSSFSLGDPPPSSRDDLRSNPEPQLPQFPRCTRDRVLDAGVDFHHTVKVRMLGLAFPQEGEEGPFLSLDDFDETKVQGPREVVFNSPRTVTACLRLGVYPRELWKEPLRIPPRGDLDAVKLQYVHQERRRKQKLAALRAERLALTLQDCDVTKKEVTLPAATQQDELLVQKAIAANHSRVQQKKLYDEKMRQKKREWDVRLEVQRVRREEAMSAQEVEARQREEALEAKARELREVREAERRAKEESLREMQDEFLETERRRREAQEERARQVEEENRAEAEKARRRQLEIRDQFELLEQDRRDQYHQKLQQAEELRMRFEEEKELRAQKAHEAAQEKKRKMAAARERSQRLEAYKVQLALERQQHAEELRQRVEAERRREAEERKAMEAERERHREETLAHALLIEETRKEAILQKLETTEERQQRLKEERAARRRRQRQERRLQVGDKLENVERMKKIDEYERFQTLLRIQEKVEKAQVLEAHKEAMKVKRRLLREEMERSKVEYPEVTPGPGEYDASIAGAERGSPSWKFGIAREEVKGLKSGKLARELLGRDSPGPGRYEADSALLLKAPKYSLPRAERFGSPICNLDDRA